MTAEIAIMNKSAIALAADSAVTIGNGDRFYNTANKLFTLSKYHPIGAMVYNKADFMEVPLEIIIKQYREFIKKNEFDYLEEYWEDFLEFLLSEELDLKKHEEDYYGRTVVSFLGEIDNSIQEKYDKKIETLKRKLSGEELREIIIDTINCYIGIFERAPDLEGLPLGFDDYIIERYDGLLTSLINEVLDITILGEENFKRVKYCCNLIFKKEVSGGLYTGLVVAGFGEKELFPAIKACKIFGIMKGHIKYIITNDVSISQETNNCIIPFAQTDIVETFMTGMSSEYLTVFDESFNNQIVSEIQNLDSSIISEKNKTSLIKNITERWKEIVSGIHDYSNNTYLYPILNSVAVAPKDELALMAESLVNLTSFKRQVSMDEYSQTVGGPIDVAVISKGDGFIWIKRKHYFDPKLNPHFFNNYYIKCQEEVYHETIDS